MYHIALCGETNIQIADNMTGDAIIQTRTGENHAVATQINHRTGGGEELPGIFTVLVSIVCCDELTLYWVSDDLFQHVIECNQLWYYFWKVTV